MADAVQRATGRVKGGDRSAAGHFRRLVGLLSPYKARWILATVALAVGGAINLALPQAAKEAIDDALARGDKGSLDLIAALALTGFVALGAMTLLRHYLMSWLGNRVVADLRDRSFRHLLRFPPGYFHERKTGALVSRLTSDIDAIQHTVGSELSVALRATLTATGALIILFVTSPTLTAVMLFVVPPLSFLAVWVGRRIRRRARQMQDQVAQANSALKEALAGIETVQTFNAERQEADRYGARVYDAFETSRHLAILRGGFMGAMQLAAYGVVTLIVWLAGAAVIDGELSGGEVVLLLAYTLMVASSLASLASLWGNLQRAIGASERVFALLDEAPTIRDRDDATPLAAPRGAVDLDAVCFSYPTRPDVPVLTDVTLAVAPGETVALVGRSGAGKSTIAALIQRFWDPDRGAIRVDGHDLRALELDSLRAAIATVAQDPVLFSGTIADNIAYGRPDASVEAIEAAARDAHIAGFVAGLPDGFDAVVGERGVKLSGGQRQRVAIARAILADPRILILDEATSHLDTENEALVHRALERLMKGRTTFIIAHRLSTVKAADRIVVLDGGRVVEQGTHESLLSGGALYPKLASTQLLVEEDP